MASKLTAIKAAAVTALFIMLQPAVTHAADSAATDDLSAYFRMLWGLLIVLGVILVIYALVRKRFNILHSRSSDNIKILEIKPVMPRKSLCLVEVKGKEYLLGIGNENITLLADINKDAGSRGNFETILEQTRRPQQ